MESVEAMFLALVSGPRLTAVEEGAENTGLVNTHLCVLSKKPVLPHPFGHV